MQFPADLFGREPVTKSGYDGSQQGTFEFVACTLLGRSCLLLRLVGVVGLAGMLFFVAGQFAADCWLANADLLGSGLLCFVLLAKRLDQVSLLQSQSFIGCHRFGWCENPKATGESIERLTFVFFWPKWFAQKIYKRGEKVICTGNAN